MIIVLCTLLMHGNVARVGRICQPYQANLPRLYGFQVHNMVCCNYSRSQQPMENHLVSKSLRNTDSTSTVHYGISDCVDTVANSQCAKDISFDLGVDRPAYITITRTYHRTGQGTPVNSIAETPHQKEDKDSGMLLKLRSIAIRQSNAFQTRTQPPWTEMMIAVPSCPSLEWRAL